MGIESYFFTILLHGPLEETEARSFFEQFCDIKPYLLPTGKLFKRYTIDEKRFAIDNRAVVRISTLEEGVNVDFELSFSNYAPNVIYIFDISKRLCSLGDSIDLILLNHNFDFSSMSLDEFKQLLQESHSDKLRYFTNRYGNIDVNILPHEFYNYIRKL